MGPRVARLQLQHTLVAGGRLVQPSGFLQGNAQVIVQAGGAGLKLQRPAATGDRGFEFPLFPERGSQVAVGLGIVRLQFQCPAVAGRCFGDPVQGAIGFAQVVMEGGRSRRDPDRPADVLDGQIVPPGLMGQHAEQVQGVGVVGFRLEDLGVKLLGSLHPPALMVLDRKGQCLGNRRHEAYYDGTARRPQCECRDQT